MRILIVGGAGLLGTRLADSLSKEGHEISICDNFSGSLRYRTTDKYRIFTPNCTDINALQHPLSVFSPEVVIMCVSHYHQRDVLYRFYEDVRLVLGSATALSSLLTKNIKHVYFCSGHEVYGGPQTNKPISEKRKIVRSATHHGSAEYVAEQLLSFRCNELNIPLTIFRIFDMYGPRIQFTPRSGVVSFLIDSFLRGDFIGLVGATKKRDFIHVDDVCRAITSVLQQGYQGTVNIGKGSGETLRSIVKELSSVMDIKDYPIELKDGALPTFSSIADVSLLNSIVPGGWEAEHNIYDDIQSLVNFREKELQFNIRTDPVHVLNVMRGIESV